MLRLGVKSQELDEIDFRQKQVKFKSYLQAWLDNDTEANWEKVIEALHNMELNNQAKDLANRVRVKELATPTATGDTGRFTCN